MSRAYLDAGQTFLDDRFPLPLDAPFTAAQARHEGVPAFELTRLANAGFLRRPIQGVYVAAQVPDSLDLRAAAVRMVLPPGGVVTDRTAGWLHGASMILAPGDHLVVPRLSVFHRDRGERFRNDLMASGQRVMPDRHVTELNGFAVTTPLRTVCDLGRLLPRTAALGAMDMLARLGLFAVADVVAAVEQFRGYRWVTQLRALAPLIDARSESPAESVIRLRWLDLSDLPAPEPQRPVHRSSTTTYRLDVGNDELRFAVEYDGWEFHHTPEQLEADRRRRRWIMENTDWIVRAVRRENVFGARWDVDRVIRAGIIDARRRGRRAA
ncbi:hypothetical protein [Nocardioides terrisoli]|uniref:hypothetical protein n=1 Tax=Nocardioides terrisoli TaxID=3388267 RepID=UPI00287BBA97|nr:hypothetical protein [Nocardioides marmorisolisilvae]